MVSEFNLQFQRNLYYTFTFISIELSNSAEEAEGVVIVIGATNRPDSLDPAIR